MSMYNEINVPKALDLINEIFTDAIKSGKHRIGDWRELTLNQLEDHLTNHFAGWIENANDDSHLANMVCRGLMLLQLQIEKGQVA